MKNVRLMMTLPLLALSALAPIAFSDEGMWLFNNPPRKLLKEKHNFDATDKWLEHVQKSSVRFNSGGSGSFVSADGLVMTNHHVGADALQKMSTSEKNYLRDGFYAKAPDQDHFLRRQRANELFSRILADPKRRWKFNQSPLFLQFLMGTRDFECTPWGNPTYNIFGWQRPCYLLQEGYAATFKELLETTRWERYGKKSGNEKCRDCMVHCGYEPTAVNHTFASWRGFRDTVTATVTGRL